MRNEKYMGDALLQKSFTIDFLNKKQKVNEGEVPQYYVKNSHPAIIEEAEWRLVQAELERRKKRGTHCHSQSLFSSRIVCGDCGAYYGRKVWHSNSQYRRVIWRCNAKYEDEKKCATPHLYEKDLKRLFLSATAKLHANRTQLLEDCAVMRDALADSTAIDLEIQRCSEAMEVLSARVQKLIEKNASTTMDQEEFQKKYDSLATEHKALEARLTKLQGNKITRSFEVDALECFMFQLEAMAALPLKFSPSLWNALIDKITVFADKRIVFRFKSRVEIEERMQV